jgi:C-terminal processing protease CtpA/Prc
MNGGGDDQLAFQVASRFTTTSVTVEYFKFRMGPRHSDFGPLMTRTLSPRGSWQFTRPVLVLIGRRCASSNESFIAAMRELPNVTLIGDRTAGSTGNPGTFPLAGGWSYTVSRWIAYTADHQVIEDIGIAPDEFVPAAPGDFAEGRDPVLDRALMAAAGGTVPFRFHRSLDDERDPTGTESMVHTRSVGRGNDKDRLGDEAPVRSDRWPPTPPTVTVPIAAIF